MFFLLFIFEFLLYLTFVPFFPLGPSFGAFEHQPFSGAVFGFQSSDLEILQFAGCLMDFEHFDELIAEHAQDLHQIHV